MANYQLDQTGEEVQAILDAVQNKETTRPVLNSSKLITSGAVRNALAEGYLLKGVADHTTNPGTPTEKVFYIASDPGTYSNFGTGISVAEGEVAILKYDTAWHKEVTGAATAAQVTELGQKLVTQNTNTGGHNLFVGSTKKSSLDNFVNVNIYNDKADAYSTPDDARIAVPYSMRTEGLTIAYKLSTGWIIERALNTLAPNNDWKDDLNWELIDSVKQSDLNSAVLDGLIISPINNFVTVGNTSLFLSYELKKGDKIYLRISNAQGASVTIGSNQTQGGSGYTQTFFSHKVLTDAEVFVEVTDDASYIKAYSAVSGIKITVYKYKETKTLLQDCENYSLIGKSELINGSVYLPCSFTEGDEIVLKIKNVQQGQSLNIGLVANSGDAGFLEHIFLSTSSEMYATDLLTIRHKCNGTYGAIKIYSTSTVPVCAAYKVIKAFDFAKSINQNALFENVEVRTIGTFIDHAVKADNYYLIKVSNVTQGANFIIGSNPSITILGYTEQFVNIKDANQSEYMVLCKAHNDEAGFKLWANATGLLVSVYSYATSVLTSYGAKGFIVAGYETDGGKNDYCVAIGSRTLRNNTGIKNVSIGNDNMADCTGHDNTSMGYHSAFRLKSGTYNAAFGSESQDDVTSGNNNTSLGFCSLQRNNTGSNNVAVGYFALDGVYDDRFDEEDQKGWEDNVAVGANAMIDAVRGSNSNVAIGKGALGSNKTYTNCIAIGKNADCTKNNQMVLGSSSITEVVVMGDKKLLFNQDGTVTWETLS